MANVIQNPFAPAGASGGRQAGRAPARRPAQGRVVQAGHARQANYQQPGMQGPQAWHGQPQYQQAPTVPGTPPWMPNLGDGRILSGGAPAPMQYQAGFQGYAPQQPQGYAPQGYAPQGYAPQGYAPPQPQGYAGYAPQQPQYPQAPQGFSPQANLQHFQSHADEVVYDGQGNWNPQRYMGGGYTSGVQALRQAGVITNPAERLFSQQPGGKWEINAYNKKEALQQAAFTLQHAVRAHKEARERRRLTPQQRQAQLEVLAAAMQDQEGFRLMGQELLLPIKDIVDYEGFARRLYRVRNLSQGELFRIAKDVRATAWVIGQDGQGVESRVYGRYVTPSEFKIGSFPTVDIADVYQMNYDVLDRAQDTARQEVELEEDKRGLALIDTAATTVNTQVTYVTLGLGAFEDVRYQVERHRLVVDKFVIHRQELSDVIKNMSAAVDPVTERELILAGYIGSFLNAMIVTSAGTGVEEVVPAGTFYATTAPEYLGEMGIRTELFSEPFNMFAQQRFVKGWAIGEIVGFVLPNPRSVAKGVK